MPQSCRLAVFAFAISMLAAQRPPAGPAAAATPILRRGAAPFEAAADPSRAPFLLRDRTVTAFFTDRGLTLAASRSDRAGLRSLSWGPVDGAALPRGEEPLPGRVNSFIGAPSRWRSDLPTFGRLFYPCIRPGIDMVVESRSHAVKVTFHAAVARDADGLRFRYDGADDLSIAADGLSLEVRTGEGSVRETGLAVQQSDASGAIRTIPARFSDARHEGGLCWSYGLELDGIDPDRPLVIDPVIVWATFLGGSYGPGYGVDGAAKVAADEDRNVYVGGFTGSANFPDKAGFDPAIGGFGDAYVAKFDYAGTLVWATYLGGTAADSAEDIRGLVIDAAHNVYVTGPTASDDFPSSGGGLPATRPTDATCAFVTKLSSTGNELAWSGYLGGIYRTTWSGGIAVAAGGDVAVTGMTDAWSFPAKELGFDSEPVSVLSGAFQGFVTRIKADGSAILWSTYVGGSTPGDSCGPVLFDGGDDLIVLGGVASPDFPVTLDAPDATFSAYSGEGNPPADVHLSRIKGDGSAILWATFLGSDSANTSASDLLAGPGGELYIVGNYATMTTSPTGYLRRFNPAPPGYEADWTETLPGASFAAVGLSVDGALAVGANAWSTTILPATENAFQPAYGGGLADAAVLKYAGDGSGVIWGSYLGGTSGDMLIDLAATPAGIWAAGDTMSDDFPVLDALDPVIGGTLGDEYMGYDAFVARISEGRFSFNAGRLEFTTVEGVDPPARDLKVYSDSPDLISWEAADDAAWLNLAPAGGTLTTGAQATMSVAVSAAGLAVGTHEAVITFDDGAGGSYLLPVTVTVTGSETPDDGGGSGDGGSGRGSCLGSSGASAGWMVLLALAAFRRRR